MKKITILLVIAFITIVVFVGVGCKQEAISEEALAEETTEETAEETTEEVSAESVKLTVAVQAAFGAKSFTKLVELYKDVKPNVEIVLDIKSDWEEYIRNGFLLLSSDDAPDASIFNCSESGR